MPPIPTPASAHTRTHARAAADWPAARSPGAWKHESTAPCCSAAVKAQKKRAGTIKELDAAVAAEQQGLAHTHPHTCARLHLATQRCAATPLAAQLHPSLPITLPLLPGRFRHVSVRPSFCEPAAVCAAATVAQQQLDQAHADVSDTQAKVDSWAVLPPSTHTYCWPAAACSLPACVQC